MASYKRPARVLVVDAIPRLPSGKALRRLLRDQYLESHGRTADT
jgi:acyl-CoA synthetase (AMP-forming)/AMP-acid ligase II